MTAFSSTTDDPSGRKRVMPTATPEQRAAGLEKAKRLRAERAASLRSNFPPDDERNWTELAARYGYRLPPYGVPVTTGSIRRMLRLLGIEVLEFQRWYGEKRETLATIAANYNRIHWPQKALSGLMLEGLDAGLITALTAPLCHAERG